MICACINHMSAVNSSSQNAIQLAHNQVKIQHVMAFNPATKAKGPDEQFVRKYIRTMFLSMLIQGTHSYSKNWNYSILNTTVDIRALILWLTRYPLLPTINPRIFPTLGPIQTVQHNFNDAYECTKQTIKNNADDAVTTLKVHACLEDWEIGMHHEDILKAFVYHDSKCVRNLPCKSLIIVAMKKASLCLERKSVCVLCDSKKQPREQVPCY